MSKVSKDCRLSPCKLCGKKTTGKFHPPGYQQLDICTDCRDIYLSVKGLKNPTLSSKLDSVMVKIKDYGLLA